MTRPIQSTIPTKPAKAQLSQGKSRVASVPKAMAPVMLAFECVVCDMPESDDFAPVRRNSISYAPGPGSLDCVRSHVSAPLARRRGLERN